MDFMYTNSLESELTSLFTSPAAPPQGKQHRGVWPGDVLLRGQGDPRGGHHARAEDRRRQPPGHRGQQGGVHQVQYISLSPLTFLCSSLTLLSGGDQLTHCIVPPWVPLKMPHRVISVASVTSTWLAKRSTGHIERYLFSCTISAPTQ